MPEEVKNIAAYSMVAAGAVLWGMIGVFVFELDKAGFTSLQIVALRVLSATIILFIYIWARHPGLLSVKPGDLHYFVGTGILSICFFNWSYFTAISEINLSIAVILLYTGPAFVVLMSRLLFGELLNLQKVTALILTLIGAFLVVGLVPFTVNGLSWYGIVVGIGAGFGYALYTIFSKFALKKYPPLTIIFYTFLFASLFMVPFSGLFSANGLRQTVDIYVLMVTAGLGFFPTALAYLLYTEGLSRIEAGKASITTMLEPVTATLLGLVVYGDFLNGYQVIGILLVLASVLIIQQKRSDEYLSLRG